MRKRFMEKLFAPELTERLAKYAQPDRDTLLRSEGKLQNAVQDGIQYEDEVHGVTEYKGHRFAPIVSLAACAVLAAGIGGIYALQANRPTDLNPGSAAENLAAQKNVPPFGDISGLELQFCESSNIVFEELPQDMVFTISAEQQSALSDALCAFSWARTNDGPTQSNDVLSMYFYTEEGYNVLQFWLKDNIVEWWHNDTDLSGKPCQVGFLYRIDDALSNCVRDIVLNNILTTYQQYIMIDSEETGSHYMHHMLSSHSTFDFFDLNELDVLFLTEDSVPEYYTIPPYQKQLLADYIADRDAWEILPSDRENGITPEGKEICMYYSTGEYESVVGFWSDGYITEQVKGDSTIKWWQTKPEMYDSLMKLIETRQDSFTLPYQYFEEAEAHPDRVLELIFGEKGAPFGDITNESIRGMCPAYAPYVAEIPAERQNTVAEAINNAVWREIPLETPEEDGESYALYVWNNYGEPYVLHFYANNLVKWDNGTEQKKFRTSADISGLVYEAMNYEDVLDHLTWVEPSDNMIADVWTAVNAAAAEADLSAYEAVLDEFNHKHRVHWAIITPENSANGGPNYADAIAEILAMTPEEYADYLEELYAQTPQPYPSMPYLDDEFTVSYRGAVGDAELPLTLTEEQRTKLITLVNDTYWTSTPGRKYEVTYDGSERDAGTAYEDVYVIRYENLVLTLCPEEHLAIWFADIDENIWSNAYYETWDELETLLNSIER